MSKQEIDSNSESEVKPNKRQKIEVNYVSLDTIQSLGDTTSSEVKDATKTVSTITDLR